MNTIITDDIYDAADDLHIAARVLMKYKFCIKEDYMWKNLENAVNRYDAAKQYVKTMPHNNANVSDLKNLEAAFIEGYEAGYENGSSDGAGFQCGERNKSSKNRNQEMNERWKYSNTQLEAIKKTYDTNQTEP